MEAKIYMNIPFSEKDLAKSKGARWDTEIKKWYFKGPVKQLSNFGKWILDGREQAIIVYESFCIMESAQMCYRCHRETNVIGFGIRAHSILSEENGKYLIDDPDDCPEEEDEIHLAWTDNENNIPPLLLQYIKKHYSTKMGYSNVVGSCFANHCDHCGSIQGNYYLFNEDSVLSTGTPDEKELAERMLRLKIYNVYTDCALVLDWDMGYCTNDWAYTHYCKKIQDIILSPTCEELWTEYSELYMIKILK